MPLIFLNLHILFCISASSQYDVEIKLMVTMGLKAYEGWFFSSWTISLVCRKLWHRFSNELLYWNDTNVPLCLDNQMVIIFYHAEH